MVPLSELVVIENGLQLRGKVDTYRDPEGDALYLQARDIAPTGIVQFDNAMPWPPASDTDRLSLRPGDLVTVNRGEGMRTGLVTTDPPMLAIPAYSLHRLTVHSPDLVDERPGGI